MKNDPRDTALLREYRQHLAKTAPDVLAAIEPLITKHNLDDKEAFDMLFAASCDLDGGVSPKAVIDSIIYDYDHGLRR